MRRRCGAVIPAGLLLLGALALAVGPAEVAGVSVAQACKEVSCFSGVVAACGSCLPAQADAFCKTPCQPSWGSLEVITCLGQAGNTYWLNNIQSLNIKCGLPPIPSASQTGTAADGGLGSVAGSTPTAADTGAAGAAGAAGTTAAGGTTTPSTIQVTTVPNQSLSTRGGGESAASAALANPAAGSAAGTAGAGSTTTAAGAAAAAGTGTDASGAGAVDTSSVGVNSAGIPNSISSTGGAGTTGTAISTGGAISSAIATFGCAATARKLNMATASNCVTSVTQNNACTQPCRAQFATFAAPCRNTMVTDSFYGDTWAGIFKLCSVPFDLRGPRVVDVPANLAGGSVVATAASTRVSTTGNEPLLQAAAPTIAEQAAPSSMVISAIPLLSAAAALLLL